MDGVKEAISILANQNQNQNTKTEAENVPNAIQIITPQPFLDERSNQQTSNESAPVYRGTRNYKASNSTNNLKTVTPKSHEQTSSEYRLITVNAGLNFNKNASSAENVRVTSSSSESTERKHRRRMTLKRNTSTTSKPATTSTTTTTTTTTTIKPVVTTSSVEIIKQEIKTIQEINDPTVKQQKLTDEVETLDKIDSSILIEAENSPPVRRFYRSSAERTKDPEMSLVNNEKVQIVRPTTAARLVGEYSNQKATIQKLDEAILGKPNLRIKKETVTIVTPEKHLRSKGT